MKTILMCVVEAETLTGALDVVNSQYPVPIFEEKDILTHAAGDKMRFKCQLCGRDKFTQKSPHRCLGGYRKRGIKWTMYLPNSEQGVHECDASKAKS